MRNWLGNGNVSVAAGATAVAETQLVSGLMAELAKEKSERYADNVGINTFKEALALIKEERETRQANMKDPHEHSDMPHESEDVRKRDCRKYKELYGKHFTKDLCEWVVERMENRNGTTHHYSLDEVKSIWHKYKMNDLHNANWYDVMYVMNMAYADFYGRLFTEHHECAMYAYLYISDPDGYEGIAFQRWLADIKAQDDEVPWQRFI